MSFSKVKLWWGFKRPKNIIEDGLGRLEREVLEATWQLGEVSVYDVQHNLKRPDSEALAYTTIMTTLDRLYKKGLLTRRKVSRAYVYQARFSQTELEQEVAQELLDSAIARQSKGSVQPILSFIVEAVSSRDRALLDELEMLIQEKRRKLKSGD